MKEFTKNNIDKLKMAVPAVILGLGASACSASDTTEGSAFISSSVLVCERATVGDSETGWTHGAATRALDKVQESAAASINLGVNNSMIKGIDTAIVDLPTYDDATKVVELVSSTLPDVGDKIEVCAEIDADSDVKVSQEIVSAQLFDKPNNQG